MTDYALNRQVPLVLSDLDPTEEGVWGPTRPLVAGMGSVHLFEQRADGTRVVLVRGTSRVRLVSILQQDPFLLCQVEPLQDERSLDEGNQFFLQRLRQGLKQWAEETLPDADSRLAFQAGLDDPFRLVELYSHYRIQDTDIRQQILESGDLNTRVALLRRVL